MTHPQSPGIQILRISNLGATHASLLGTAHEAKEAGFDAILITDDGTDGVDPIAAAAALAPLTTLGVIPEVDTAIQHPFGLARRLVGLDQVSYGRAGWAPKDTNPGRLSEAVEIITKLWDSWPDGVVVADKERAVWVETERIFPVVVDGEHYSVRAPLDFHRGPQGHLLLVTSRENAHLATFTPPIYLEDVYVVDYAAGHRVPAPARPAAVATTLRERAGLERVSA